MGASFSSLRPKAGKRRRDGSERIFHLSPPSVFRVLGSEWRFVDVPTPFDVRTQRREFGLVSPDLPQRCREGFRRISLNQRGNGSMCAAEPSDLHLRKGYMVLRKGKISGFVGTCDYAPEPWPIPRSNYARTDGGPCISRRRRRSRGMAATRTRPLRLLSL